MTRHLSVAAFALLTSSSGCAGPSELDEELPVGTQESALDGSWYPVHCGDEDACWGNYYACAEPDGSVCDRQLRECLFGGYDLGSWVLSAQVWSETAQPNCWCSGCIGGTCTFSGSGFSWTPGYVFSQLYQEFEATVLEREYFGGCVMERTFAEPRNHMCWRQELECSGYEMPARCETHWSEPHPRCY